LKRSVRHFHLIRKLGDEIMKQRVFNLFVVLSMILWMFSFAAPAQAEDPFPSPDADGDGLPNEMEVVGWYNLSGGPYMTDPRDLDSDDDGLTDGEEKLFDTNPLDPYSPGLAVIYQDSFKTRQYFSTTDPKYLSIIQFGDQYLLTEALVVRRGTVFNIAGPASGTLTLSGTGMTALTPTKDPRGGWAVSIPVNGTVGTYIATVTDGAWSKSMPIYVIFELPTTLPEDQVAAFLYDDDPTNKKDEVAVFWTMPEWPYYGDYQDTVQPCPGTDPNAPCSLWQYHLAYGYAQAYWTEQFTKSVFIDHAIKAMHGKNTMTAAINALASWIDYEFRTRSGRVQNNWTSAMYRWFDGTGITSNGGYCETTSTTFTTILRSAGIAARPFAMDYNKTSGHGESGQIGTIYQYDHSVMMWMDNKWYAKRAYGGDEVGDLYYPWNSGTTGTYTLDTWDTASGYYNDYYGDGIFAVNQDWTFQTSTGVGTVNTTWSNGVPGSYEPANRDYEYSTHKPLEIRQSPHVDVLNCLMWQGDNWAPSEWRTPIVSNPAGRNATLTYFLPSGVPDPANPLENWPYNPQPTSCSASTPIAECNAFKAGWSTNTCAGVAGMYTASTPMVQIVDAGHLLFMPILSYGNASLDITVRIGDIISDYGVDRDDDGHFDELILEVEVTSGEAAKIQFGGLLQMGDLPIRAYPQELMLKKGVQTIQIAFDGQQIGDQSVDGPYQVTALWAADPDLAILHVVDPDKMLDYQEFTYFTGEYKAVEFEYLDAAFTGDYSHTGVDRDGNGLYESIIINAPLDIKRPGTFLVEGDLYDGLGEFVGQASWTGSDANASLQFDVSKTQPPYSLQHLNLIKYMGPILDSRFAPEYLIEDLDGKIEVGAVSIGASAGDMIIAGVDPAGTYTFNLVDTNGNGLNDILRVSVGVTVTNVGGVYRIEGLLVDDYGTEIAWAVSNPQALALGTNTMTLEFDGKMLYDQLPLTGSRAFKLVAVKIFSGNLSPATLESQVNYAGTTPIYTRSQFEPSSPAITVFQDDMESGTGQWSLTDASVTGEGTIYRVNRGTAIGGTFLLTVDSKTTAPIAYNATYTTVTAATVRTALTNAGIATTSVSGSGTLTSPWLITFSAAPTTVTMDKTDLITGGYSIWSFDGNVTGTGTIYFVNVGPAIGGNFLLTVDSKTTAPVDWNATSTSFRTALTNAGITTASVTGSGTLASPWVITFSVAPTTVAMDTTGLVIASHSGSHAWKASTTVNYAAQQLVMASPLNLMDYASPVLRFNHAYQLGHANDKAILEVSTDGTTWTAIKTFTGINTTPHWITEEIDLGAYGEMENVYLRFNAQRANTTGSVSWYVDDVTINAWPAIKTPTFTYSTPVEEGIPNTFTASYTSIDDSLPVTYKWNFAGQEFVTTRQLTISFSPIPAIFRLR
jgi:hypothetical protein